MFQFNLKKPLDLDLKKLELRYWAWINYSPQGPCFIEYSNDLNEDFIKILDELHNSSTLKDDFRQACNEAFIHNNSPSIIDFNVDPQLNMLTCKIN